MQSFVGWQGDTRLDALLARTAVPNDFDLLSIDVDGPDYLIWQAVEAYSPKVVVIEYNETIPPFVEFFDGSGLHHIAASAKSLEALGDAKGYSVAAMTKTNLIFVRADLFGALSIPHQTVEELFDYSQLLYVIASFKGRCFVTPSSLPLVDPGTIRGVLAQTDEAPVGLHQVVVADIGVVRRLFPWLHPLLRGALWVRRQRWWRRR